MRIAQISTLDTPVRRVGSASVQSVVWLLTQELVKLGHDLTVFGADGSEVPPGAEFVATLPGPYTQSGSPHDWTTCEWINLASAVARSGEFDLMHSHSYLWALPLQRLAKCPLVSTMHVTPYDDDARLWALMPEANVIAISQYQWGRFPRLTPAAVIHHGIDTSLFTFKQTPEDYLLWMGRFIPEKGALEAIAIAKQVGIPLVLAAPPDEYYDQAVAPHVDGKAVRYAGFVSGKERDALLGGARALLYPNLAPEPFGLVLVEAMLCGVPVVATRIGAVPEIVEEGITGALGDTVEQLPGRVAGALSLDRAAVRARVEERFNAARMARRHADAYERIVRTVA